MKLESASLIKTMKKEKLPPLNIDRFIDLGLKEYISAIDEATAYGVFSEQMRKAVAKRKNFPEINMPLLFGSSNASPKQRVFKNYRNLSQRYSLLASLTASEDFLFNPYLSLTLAIRARENGGTLTLGEVQKIQRDCIEEGKRSHIWWKFYRLAKKEKIKLTWASYFSTLVSLRNFFSHRQGAVGPFDVGKDGYLKVSWKRPSLYLAKKRIERLPFVAEKGDLLKIKSRKIQRKYKPGQKIKFDLKDTRDICWTLMMFGLEAANNTKKRVVEIIEETKEK